MKVLVTGATGFVGRWLIPELETAGHDAVAAPGSASLDVTDERAVARLIAGVRPDAVAHLAGSGHRSFPTGGARARSAFGHFHPQVCGV